ncbi:hypothetical protein MKW94_016938 [Papaver nudicaule]|uniref:Uncharacterized protein n=1 Tax=Papaver nudicaule TaxID=74823 RepID=A0AA42AXP7_PAPNU|nr:hypothetical protein [Papaver nudicaule]
MDEEQLFDLFDSNWFYTAPSSISPFATNPDLEFPFKPLKAENELKRIKSLSDLEFEELKGFMDLGFVFSEEDRNSSLIPGLQRLGNKENLITEKQQEILRWIAYKNQHLQTINEHHFDDHRKNLEEEIFFFFC